MEFSNIQLEYKNTFNGGYLTGRPADTNQVSAGLFVQLFAQPTRPATLHSEFHKAREYNSICIVRSQRKGTWYLYRNADDVEVPGTFTPVWEDP